MDTKEFFPFGVGHHFQESVGHTGNLSTSNFMKVGSTDQCLPVFVYGFLFARNRQD